MIPAHLALGLADVSKSRAGLNCDCQFVQTGGRDPVRFGQKLDKAFVLVINILKSSLSCDQIAEQTRHLY